MHVFPTLSPQDWSMLEKMPVSFKEAMLWA